jgi:hypothetical protein
MLSFSFYKNNVISNNKRIKEKETEGKDKRGEKATEKIIIYYHCITYTHDTHTSY